jgi:hypothetical protein
MCSLAFLPIFLAAALITLGQIVFRLRFVAIDDQRSGVEASLLARPRFPWLTLIAAAIGFVVPTLMLWQFNKINMLSVWLWNYQNHAGFYQQYPRTYWKWLLVNKVEAAYALGWPVALLCVFASFNLIVDLVRRGVSAISIRRYELIVFLFVWGLLWVSGKNSGEAARLWNLLYPWGVMLASTQIERIAGQQSYVNARQRGLLFIFALQLLVSLLTVARVSGFGLAFQRVD